MHLFKHYKQIFLNTLMSFLQTIALHSEMMKKSRVDAWDVNTVFMLTDTSPVAGACGSQYASFGDDNKYCCQIVSLALFFY